MRLGIQEVTEVRGRVSMRISGDANFPNFFEVFPGYIVTIQYMVTSLILEAPWFRMLKEKKKSLL